MTEAGFANARPSDRLLLRGAKQIVTLQGPARIRRGDELRDVGLIRDGSILVEGGFISQVGTARRVENLKAATNARELDARNLVVLPGFLDAVGDLLPLERATPSHDREELHGADEFAASHYEEISLRTVVRNLERQLSRLGRWGTTFAQFRVRFPEEAALQSRLLRNLLQLEIPVGGFRVDLHFHQLPPMPPAKSDWFPTQLPPAAIGYWKSLESALSVSLRSATLDALSAAEARRTLRRLCSGLPALLTEPLQISWERLLSLCSGSGAGVYGLPPQQPEAQRRFGLFGVPWILPGGEYLNSRLHAPATLRNAIQNGMHLALASGYDVNRRGSMSPLLLAHPLLMQDGLEPAEMLQLSIANLAYALGEGHRMGSIRAGCEANLVLLDCDDYREISYNLGAVPILATYRRGAILQSPVATRG